MRLLVTGGSGLLGSAVAALSIRKGYDTYTGFNQHPASEGTPTLLDVTDTLTVEEAFKSVRPDVVVHSAAMTHVDRCEENRELATLVNVEGTRNVAREAEKLGAFLLYVSTDYVFSGEKGDYRENDTPYPINHYGATKLDGARIVASSGAAYCIARPSVIYGSRPAAGKENFVLWVIKQLSTDKPIQIINDQWVSPTLNTNLAEMVLEVIQRQLTGIYHLSGATPINRYDFTLRIAKEFNLDESLITPVTSKEMKWAAKRPMNSSLNVSKASSTLRNKPMRIEEALRRLRSELKLTKV